MLSESSAVPEYLELSSRGSTCVAKTFQWQKGAVDHLKLNGMEWITQDRIAEHRSVLMCVYVVALVQPQVHWRLYLLHNSPRSFCKACCCCSSFGRGSVCVCAESIKGPDANEFVYTQLLHYAICSCARAVDCSNLFYGHKCICLAGLLITGLELEQCEWMAMTEEYRQRPARFVGFVWLGGQLNRQVTDWRTGHRSRKRPILHGGLGNPVWSTCNGTGNWQWGAEMAEESSEPELNKQNRLFWI